LPSLKSAPILRDAAGGCRHGIRLVIFLVGIDPYLPRREFALGDGRPASSRVALTSHHSGNPDESAKSGLRALPVFAGGSQWDTMSREKRKAARRRVNVPVFLYTTDGRPLGESKMRDISEGGARLASLDGDQLPDELLLSFSRDGKVRRRCQLVWRNDEEMGVRFYQNGQ
jgi:hypothetical protein